MEFGKRKIFACKKRNALDPAVRKKMIDYVREYYGMTISQSKLDTYYNNSFIFHMTRSIHNLLLRF